MTTFGAFDYSIFIGVITTSIALGLYFAFKDRNKSTYESYYYGERKMSPIPVGMSIAVSFISSVTMMGYPVEAYLYGTVWLWLLLAFPLLTVATSVYFIPVYYNLRLKTIYEYMDLRFNKLCRMFCSISFGCYMIGYLATIVYLPSLAITALLPISLNWTIIITSVTCTFYTVLGGFKSVVWADTVQSFIMLFGTLALFIQGVVVNGGISAVVQALNRGNRSNFLYSDSFDLHPTTRCSFWSVIVGNFVAWIMVTAASQADVQRYMSCRSLLAAQLAPFVSLVPQMMITMLALFTGFVAYAYFEGCDPVLNGEINRHDQLTSYLVQKLFENIPGATGLFIASIYCGTLSTVSTGINAVSAMLVQDIIPMRTKSERKIIVRSKIIGIALGALTLVLSFGISQLPGTIVRISNTVLSSFGPSVLGMFILGIFFPWCNSTGAITGGLIGAGVTGWVSIGSLFLSTPRVQHLEITTETCLNQSLVQVVVKNDDFEALSIYDMSFLYLRPLSLFVTLIVGIIVSFITGSNDPTKMNPDLFMPLISSKIFPEKVVAFMRFGVPLKEVEKSIETIPINENKDGLL